MRVAVLYVCTGRYSLFWDGFYESCERFFLPKHEKHYFVFTDQGISPHDSERVHRIQQENLGWPMIALKRYHIFEPIEQQLKEEFDFACFYNANARFVAPVDDSYLPDKYEGIVLHDHPGMYWKPNILFPYERRKTSSAHIPYGTGDHYYCGGLHGGYIPEYLDFLSCIRKSTDSDLANDVVAIWHDDSHLNKCALQRPCKVVDAGHATPDGRNLPFPKKIRLIDKRSMGGHDYLRGITEQKQKTLKERFVFRPSFPKGNNDRPVVLARLLGGLGNQMFIYAAAYSVAKRLNAELAFDTGALQSDAIRRYELHCLGIMEPQWRVPRLADKLLCKWFSLSKKLNATTATWTHAPCPKAYSPCLGQLSGNVYLTGYWQCAQYFSEYETELREILRPAPKLSEELQTWEERMTGQPTVFVHLRRGDYKNPENMQRHGLLTLDYYEKAREQMEKDGVKRQYAIFSDDTEEAKKLFSHWDDTIFLPPADHLEHLHLMSQCTDAIIANSSFSWWAAWLGKTEEQRVIAPKQWFAVGVEAPFRVGDLYLPHWELV